MTVLEFAHPWLLALLPLAVLPLLRAPTAGFTYSWLERVPPDVLSRVLGLLLPLVGLVAIGATVCGLAGPGRPEVAVERMGQGAEVLILLDRSRSMDQSFGVDTTQPAFAGTPRPPKGQVARELLSRFVAQRGDDLYALVAFSTFPIPILDFTQSQEMIQAAIAAGGVGRGLADTDIGRALLTAAARFEDRPYAGSRVILLVSDGGAQLDPDTRERIVRTMKRNRIALYWIYIRSFRSVGLFADTPNADDDTVPERSLHAFFRSMGTPYRAYEAENPEALQRAMEDVDRLEKLPIHYTEVMPREDLSGRCYALALAAAAVLALASLLEIRRWV